MTLLPPHEIEKRLADLPGWQVAGGQLTKTFQTASFTHAAMFVGAIGQFAEAAGHHPDLRLHGYNKVTVELSTHSAGGLTDKDFSLAMQIEALPHKKPKSAV